MLGQFTLQCDALIGLNHGNCNLSHGELVGGATQVILVSMLIGFQTLCALAEIYCNAATREFLC